MKSFAPLILSRTHVFGDLVSADRSLSNEYLKSAAKTSLPFENLIPFFKPMGKKIYFLKQELRNWLLRNRHATEQELEQNAIDYVTLKEESV